jgi:hypothetical protein
VILLKALTYQPAWASVTKAFAVSKIHLKHHLAPMMLISVHITFHVVSFRKELLVKGSRSIKIRQ